MSARDCCEPGCSAEALCPVHQVLADLRAEVKGLVAYSVPLGHEWVDGVGWLSTNKVIDTVLVSDVLALIDGGQK